MSRGLPPVIHTFKLTINLLLFGGENPILWDLVLSFHYSIILIHSSIRRLGSLQGTFHLQLCLILNIKGLGRVPTWDLRPRLQIKFVLKLMTSKKFVLLSESKIDPTKRTPLFFWTSDQTARPWFGIPSIFDWNGILGFAIYYSLIKSIVLNYFEPSLVPESWVR